MSKNTQAFRNISEVAKELDLPSHVLRFWETKFKQIEPVKRAGGRRYYRPEDVALIIRIKELLYNQGYTIRGAQTLLKKDKKGENAPSVAVIASESALVAEDSATGVPAAEAGISFSQDIPFPHDNSADKVVALPPENEGRDVIRMRQQMEHILTELKDIRAELAEVLSAS